MTDVAALYAGDPEREWARLQRDPFHRLEYDTTLRFLEPLLPSAGRVLDAGGGPGRYALALAQRGLQVTLFDLTPELLDIARREAQRAGVLTQIDIIQGSITNLSAFPDASFAATLCLGGPLSHVRGASARAQAVAELVRVTRPGGLVAVSVMSRLAVVIEAAAHWPQEIADDGVWRGLWQDGEDEHFAGQNYCHFFMLAELEALLEGAGLRIMQGIGLESIGAHHWDAVNRLAAEEPASYAHWLEAQLALATDPAIVATSGHMLLLCRKPGGDQPDTRDKA